MKDSETIEIREFSGFRLDLPARRLTDPHGAEIALSARVFDTLAHLAAHPGRVIDKRELLDAVWAGVLVEENNLAHAISTLRRVLGDRRERPRFIATVQGRGYQFVAPVRVSGRATSGSAREIVPQRTAGTTPSLPVAGLATLRGRLRGGNRLWRIGTAGVLAAMATLLAVLVWQPPAPHPPTAGMAAAAPRHLVAMPPEEAGDVALVVLPFADRSESGDRAYFAEGLSDQLRDQLDRVDGLLVMGQTSSYAIRNRIEPLPGLADALGFDYVLDGNVRTSGDRLRVSAELIDAASGYSIWRDTYDREAGDVFDVQESITHLVVAALSDVLGTRAALTAPKWETTANAEAYDTYLRAAELLRASGAENARRAEALFREVIALDPDYMPAQRGLLAALIFVVNFYPERAEASFEDMNALLTDAIERAPSADIAHQLRAFQKLRVHNDRLGARQELDAGIRIAPQERRVQLEELLDIIRAQTGWLSATVELARSRAGAEPLSLETSRRLQGALTGAGLIEEAEAEYERSRDLQGDRMLIEQTALLRAVQQGFSRSIIIERNARLKAAMPAVQADVFDPVLFLDHPEQALAGLRRELDRASDPAAMNAFWVALWADHFGDAELALEATAMSYRRSRGTAYNPAWALHRSGRLPAFRTFVREQGFEAYWRTTGEWGDFCRPIGDEDFVCF